MPPIDPDVARLRAAAEALTAAQRLALANEIILSTDDPDCRFAVSLVVHNATMVAGALERRAFIERDARRRVF